MQCSSHFEDSFASILGTFGLVLKSRALFHQHIEADFFDTPVGTNHLDRLLDHLLGVTEDELMKRVDTV